MPICKQCGTDFKRRSDQGRPPTRCNVCKDSRQRELNRDFMRKSRKRTVSVDLKYLRLVFEMAKDCDQSKPCEDCTIQLFCPILRKLVES
jgi:hypothetical protein